MGTFSLIYLGGKYEMRWNQIVEGRDAPLYHGTKPYRAQKIIESNVLYGSPPRPGLIGFPEKFVSLTRDLSFAKHWADPGVVFELNQTLLAQRYQIRPIDVNAHWTKDGGANYGRSTMAEEMVIGDITNLSKYLIKIWVLDPEWDSLGSYGYDKLLKHPLVVNAQGNPLHSI